MLCSHVNAEEMKKDVESEASMEPIGNSQIDAEDGDKENVSVCIYLYGSVHTYVLILKTAFSIYYNIP